ncbi:MAG: hypothetical protein ACHQ51_11200 [Elusimicrobiota bacterium]
MKPLLSRFISAVLSAAIVLGAAPPAAFAGESDNVTPSAAMDQMKSWGVFKGDDDALKGYLGDGKRLTPLGKAVYQSLVKTHGAGPQAARARAEEVQGMQPALDRLRQNGPYNEARAQGMERAVQSFQKYFGVADAGSDGSVESEFQRGALREAVMTGAAVADPPRKDETIQVPTKDGFEFWDKKGLAFRINKNNATTYSRELQKIQHIYNQTRPPEVAFIPETGRYNPEMFDYSYFLMKGQYDALVEGMRRDRTIALAELLGVSGKYREDMWFTDKRIQADLESQARNKTYNHDGQDFNVLELVDAKFKQRKYYLEEAAKGVARYKADMDGLKSKLGLYPLSKTSGPAPKLSAAEQKLLDGVMKDAADAAVKDLGDQAEALNNGSNAGSILNPIISDAQTENLRMDEQYAKRFLTLGVLETQAFYVKNQIERLDPASPDSEQVMKAIDHMDLTAEQKAAYKLRAGEMVARLRALSDVLERTRKALHASDYASSMDNVTAILTSSQRTLGQISTDYAMFVEVPSISYLSNEQTHVSWMNWGSKIVTRPLYGAANSLVGGDYRHTIGQIEADQPKYTAIARQIAAGDIAGARQSVIQMNPDAIKGAFAIALGGDAAPNTDSARLAAALKVGHERIADVFETNKWLDAGGNFITWSVDVALAAPVLRMGASGLASRLAAFTGEAGESSALARFTVVRGGSRYLRESLLHTADRLGKLNADPLMIAGKTSNPVAQYFLASGYRAVTAAGRQASFTAMSGVISGAFTLGQHAWDLGTEKLMGPGQSATLSYSSHTFLGMHMTNGEIGLRPGDSMFNSDFRGAADAFWTGAKGGIWWANSPMEMGGIPVFHPAMLGYINLMPTTAFRGTSFMRYAEAFGARGVVGASLSSAKMLLAGESAATAEAVAEKGLLEKMAATGKLGGAAAFSLSMVDNVAKYSLFSYGAESLASEYAYHWGERTEPDEERRIKAANAFGQEALASPAWLLIPAYSAHPQTDAAMYMRSSEGAQQYREIGMDHLIANAAEGDRMRFIKTPETPLSQKFFEFTYKGAETGDYFMVTKDLKREAIKNQMLHGLGGENATLAEVNPMKFYRVTKQGDGADAVNLKVNDEVRLVAHQDFVESLLADPKRAERVLDAVAGSEVEGFGRVTPEVKKDVAVALFSSEMQTGKAMPKELAGKVGELLKSYLEANRMVQPAAESLVAALKAAPEKSDALDAALKDAMTKASEWKEHQAGQRPYTELVKDLSRTADELKASGKLTAAEYDVLSGVYKYLDAIEGRFNAFNNVGMTKKLASESLGALKVEHGGNAAVMKMLNEFSAGLDTWASGRPQTEVVDRPGVDTPYKRMLATMTKDLEKARPNLSEADFDTLKAAIGDMASAPWVLHDSKGTALASWKPEQFESLMGAMSSIATQGRAGNTVRLFQMLKTGGGKTMLTFEGLLPLVEADAKKEGIQPMFLTVQSNLEAQARMEFIAFKKIGSSLQFDTYEGFKTKIAEGKMKGRTALRDYWILGDEMDGAALQPALTIGQVSGGITRRSPIFNRIDEVDQTMSSRLNAARDARDTRLLTETRRVLDDVGGLDQTGASAKISGQAKLEAIKLEAAARDLKSAGGPEARLNAESEIRARAGKLSDLLGTVPSRENAKVEPARQGIKRLLAAMDAPAAEPQAAGGIKAKLFSKPGATPETRAREALLSDLQGGFARQENLLGLTGSESGLTRLALDANTRGAELEGRIERLQIRQRAEQGSAEPGAAARAKAIGEELDLAGRELAIVDRFRSADAGLRLSGLQEKLAAAEGEPGSASAESVAAWKRKAADFEAALPAESRPSAQERAEALGRLYGIGREIKVLDGKIAEGTRKSENVESLVAQRSAFDGDYATTRAEVDRLKNDIASGSASGDLGGMLRRLDVLNAETRSLEGTVQAAKARGERAGPAAARLAEARSEHDAVLKTAVEEVRRRLSASADDVLALAKEGKDGWQGSAARLMERRREMMESFAGNENPMYTVFREMKDDMQGFALNEALKSDDPAVWKPAQRKLMRMVDGDSALAFAPKLPKLLYEVFTGKDIDIPMNEVGLTRLHAAKMLKALLSDPTIPTNQRDNLFWSLTGSIIKPGGAGDTAKIDAQIATKRAEVDAIRAQLASGAEGADAAKLTGRLSGLEADIARLDQTTGEVRNSSWVRTELLRQLRGFFEDSAGIRVDNRTGKINVVHNGQWFESMDNESRRFWELEYGVDLTLPYTNQSISTIKDVTTDKKARFISFSGTAGEKLREHFKSNGIRIEGQGSTPPAIVELDVLAGPTNRFTRIGQGLSRVDSAVDRVEVSGLKGAPDGVRSAIEKQLVDLKAKETPETPRAQIEAKVRRELAGDAVLRMTDFTDPSLSEARAWLLQQRKGQGKVVVNSLTDAPEPVRQAIEKKLGRPLREPTSLKLSDFAGPENALTREWLWNERLMQGDADQVVVRKLTDLPKMSEENAKALKARIAAGEVSGDAREALERVLSLDAVSPKGREALEAHMKSWDKEPLTALRNAVESQLASNVPREVREVVDAHLAAAKLAGKDEAVVRISDVTGKTDAATMAARDWLRDLRGNQRESGLVVLSVSDTRVLKMVREYLMRVQGLKADEISMVFSDTEYLRNNVPEAEVAKQMNLDAMNTGKARVLILDTRVGGRGLDLNFKGERGNLDPKAFRGYTSFEMLLVDPQKMSSVHMLQAEGRIDVGRVLPGARREFSLVMDVKSVESEPVFRDMIAKDPFFAERRNDPKFMEFARKRGVVKPDWAVYHDYLFDRATDGSAEGSALAERYKKVVNEYLERGQGEVEENQLRSSSVLTDQLRTNGRFPGIEAMR